MTRTEASVGSLLQDAETRFAHSGIDAARLEAEVLLARAMGTTRAGLIGSARDAVPGPAREAFLAAVERRSTRYPLQYITGIQEFYSLEFEVDSRVLIPRAETEMIVEDVLRRAGAGRAPAAPAGATRPGETPSGGAITIADVGTGSGCIAVTLARHLPAARVMATDVSPGALEVAARNAARHGVADRVELLLGRGLEPLRAEIGVIGGSGQSAVRRGLDVLVSNPPYIAASELASLQPELAFEPREALTSGPSGLEVIEEILRGAAALVAPSGWLMIELGAGRHREVEALVDREAWDLEPTKPDMQGIPRLLIARRRS